MKLLRTLLIVPLSVLSSCTPGYDLLVQILAGGRVQIAVDQSDAGDEPLCMADLSIEEFTAPEITGAEVWSVVGGRCLTSITYPEVPTGFRPEKHGRLVSGKQYRASAFVGAGIGRSPVFRAP
jgi:hypothetical protein